MDEKSGQILEHIEEQRNQLGANLNELETRVRRTADWRAHFDNNPMLMLAGALGGGILLGAMINGSKSRSSGSGYTSSRHFSSSGTGTSANTGTATYLQKQRASETIDNIKAGLIAFATAKAKEFLNQALPGFDNYVREAESNRSHSQFSSGREHNQGPNYGSGSYNTGGYNSGLYGEQTSGQGQGANYGQNYGTDYTSHGPGQRNYPTDPTYRNS